MKKSEALVWLEKVYRMEPEEIARRLGIPIEIAPLVILGIGRVEYGEIRATQDEINLGREIVELRGVTIAGNRTKQ